MNYRFQLISSGSLCCRWVFHWRNRSFYTDCYLRTIPSDVITHSNIHGRSLSSSSSGEFYRFQEPYINGPLDRCLFQIREELISDVSLFYKDNLYSFDRWRNFWSR